MVDSPALMSLSMVPGEVSGALKARLADAALYETHEGFSGSQVFRVEYNHQPVAYLKIARRGTADDLQPELARLLWLDAYREGLPVPRVQYYGESGDWQYLLIESLPGVGIHDELLRDHLPDVLTITAQTLRRIHEIPVGTCPFDMTLDVKIAQAHRHLSQGWVDESDFDAERQGQSAEAVFQQLIATRPADEDRVFTHGDYCAPNILLHPETLALTGLIDWGRAGIADRYQDLALHTRSILYNFGTGWAHHFLYAYGLNAVDEAKLAFYRLLDEFF